MGSHDESKPDDTRTDLGSVSNDNKEEIIWYVDIYIWLLKS